jgi:hypothetical protein
MILGGDEDAIEAAWVVFRQAMVRHGAYATVITQDHALGETVLTMFRSWPDACKTDLSPEMWAAKRKEFSRVYSMLRRRAVPASLIEPANDSSQFEELSAQSRNS